jgi:hypothetical protein
VAGFLIVTGFIVVDGLGFLHPDMGLCGGNGICGFRGFGGITLAAGEQNSEAHHGSGKEQFLFHNFILQS